MNSISNDFVYRFPKEKIQNDPELIVLKKKMKRLSRFPMSPKNELRMIEIATRNSLWKKQIINAHAKAFEYNYLPFDINMLMQCEAFDQVIPDGIDLGEPQPSGGALPW